MSRYMSILVIFITILNSCSKEGSIEIDPSQNSVDNSWAPLNRTTSNINVVEEDILNLQINSV